MLNTNADLFGVQLHRFFEGVELRSQSGCVGVGSILPVAKNVTFDHFVRAEGSVPIGVDSMLKGDSPIRALALARRSGKLSEGAIKRDHIQLRITRHGLTGWAAAG